jgi:hypothetical protein
MPSPESPRPVPACQGPIPAGRAPVSAQLARSCFAEVAQVRSLLTAADPDSAHFVVKVEPEGSDEILGPKKKEPWSPDGWGL